MKLFAILLISAAAFSQTDGPATLPQRTMETRASFTPSSNYPKYVGPNDSLPAALAAAVPGDTIVWDEASTLNVGAAGLTLPTGTPGQWITVRTSSSLIPDEYTRITPAFAAHMPKIVITVSSGTVKGGNYVRLIGLDISRPVGTGIVYSLLSNLGDHVILDRLIIQGTPTDETNRGVSLNNSTNTAVVNSWLDEFHCFAVVGVCVDSQAIAGGGSSVPDGPFLIQNNYIRAAGEGVIFGGSGAAVVSSDGTILHNTFDKALSWNPSDPSYSPAISKDGLPHPWIVKNNLELKNAARFLVEGNIFGPVWGGFTQVGASVLLTAKNQAGANGTNLCPICAVTDITIRYNHGSYEAQALQIGCSVGGNGGWPAECARYSIHDNLFDNLQYKTCYSCGSFTNLIGGGGVTVLQHVSGDHNTFLLETPGKWIGYGGVYGATNGATGVLTLSSPPVGATPQELDINWTNNLFDVGNEGAYSSGGGTGNCWSTPATLKDKFANCWQGGSFVGNQLVNSVPFKGQLPWPSGNDSNPSAGANLSLVDAATSQGR